MDNEQLLDGAKVFTTARTLTREYYGLLNHFKLNAGNYNLEPATLNNLVERYWLDVDRLHRYHDMERIDRHKIAGYLTYWICKLRPIAVIKTNSDLNDAAIPLHINELFAVFVALGRLQGQYRALKSGCTLILKDNLCNALLYNLRYRPVTGDMLSMMYYLIEESRPD
ncbi:MAG: hypothetical protein FWB85_06860 [Chitinispirillia bacterium]|nr:hypothetical protein [Chitinispirillia bacterium]MCL2241955.1 hypothetical protein [Chitinispirillia bacterium]